MKNKIIWGIVFALAILTTIVNAGMIGYHAGANNSANMLAEALNRLDTHQLTSVPPEGTQAEQSQAVPLLMSPLGLYRNPYVPEMFPTKLIDMSNTWLGVDALKAVLSRDIDTPYAMGNVAIGYAALRSNLSYNIVAVGAYAGQDNKIGKEFVAIGTCAGQSNNTDYGVYVGTNSGISNIKGKAIIAIGTSSLQNINDDYNLGVGYEAAIGLLEGRYNDVTGYMVFHNNKISSGNSIDGANALFYNQGNGLNAVKGSTAFYNNIEGERLSGIGALIYYMNQHGTGLVGLGYGAGFWETESDKLYIDNRIRDSEEDGRNKALIYGVFADTVAEQKLVFNADTVQFGTFTANTTLVPVGYITINDSQGIPRKLMIAQ